MERPHQLIKPLLKRETRINSPFVYRNFIKKGYRTLPKLTLRFEDNDAETPQDQRISKKAKLLRLFKEIKFTRNLDLNRFLVSGLHFYFATCLYIAKRMAQTSCLSVFDVKIPETNYKGFVTPWPKYMKRLKSLFYDIDVDLSNPKMSILVDEDSASYIAELPKNVKLCVDYMRYLPKLEIFKVNFPGTDYSSALDSLWRFEKYPVSIKKISFNYAKCRYRPLETSLAHLKNLKNLKIGLSDHNCVETIKSLFELLLQAPQLEALALNFKVSLDVVDVLPLKKLDKLKKVKLRIISGKDDTLKAILESFEECSLEEFHLDVKMTAKSDQEKDTSVIKDFINRKKNSMKVLKIDIKYSNQFKSFEDIAELLKAIDNIPELLSLSFLAKITTQDVVKTEIPVEIGSLFENLFSRASGLKKFTIVFNQFTFPKNGFFKLVGSLQSPPPILGGPQIDIGGGYQFQGSSEPNLMINWIRNLKNIRSLKLLSLDIRRESFFIELVEAIEALKYLRAFRIGQVFKEVTIPSFASGVERILQKPGLGQSPFGLDADFRGSFRGEPVPNCAVNLEEILKKNVHLQAVAHLPIYTYSNGNSLWD